MVFTRFVEIGRIAYVSSGADEGKLVVIVDVIDQNRALVDGPCTNVKRQSMGFKGMHLTKIVMDCPPSARTGTVKRKWIAQGITKKWDETTWAKKIALRKLKIGMGDLDRFILMKARQARNLLIKIEINKVRKTLKIKPKRVNKKPHLSATVKVHLAAAKEAAEAKSTESKKE